MLEHMSEVFDCLRCANVALRWLFLHACSSHKKLRAAVASSAPPMEDLLAVLLDTALLEFEVTRHVTPDWLICVPCAQICAHCMVLFPLVMCFEVA